MAKVNITQFPPMEKALEEARAAAARDEVPVGAVVVDAKGTIIARAGNRVEELNDPSAHAEILALRQACAKLGTPRLEGCDLYVTLEPCPMCAQAISFARVRRVYYGAADEKMGGVENGARIFKSSSCHHKPEVIDGIMATPCRELLQDFFKKKR